MDENTKKPIICNVGIKFTLKSNILLIFHFIQTRDDNLPEQKQVYTLELTSADSGATINNNARSAQILVVASDYPHGLFEFEYPAEVTVEEDSTQV